MSRPILDKKIDPEDFQNYYWLKEELLEFCRKYFLPCQGSKKELAERIFHFLKTGTILSTKNKNLIDSEYKKGSHILTLDSKIPVGYKNDEIHRNFFQSVIGKHFKFNVPFMSWMKNNSGKTYNDAVNEYYSIINEKRNGTKTEISSQFEYNQYTRDFFNANPNRSRAEAISCWNFKKALPGNNKYEDDDLKILNQ